MEIELTLHDFTIVLVAAREVLDAINEQIAIEEDGFERKSSEEELESLKKESVELDVALARIATWLLDQTGIKVDYGY